LKRKPRLPVLFATPLSYPALHPSPGIIDVKARNRGGCCQASCLGVVVMAQREIVTDDRLESFPNCIVGDLPPLRGDLRHGTNDRKGNQLVF
jgi:hypothetical protein